MSNSPPTPLDDFFTVAVQQSAAALPQRPAINFLGDVSIADNPANGSTDVTIGAGGGQYTASLNAGLNSNVSQNGLASLRVSAPGAFSIGGIELPGGATPGPGQRQTIINTSANPLSFVNDDGSSTAKYRITVGGGAPYVFLKGYATAVLEYDGTTSRWVLQNDGLKRPHYFDVRDYGADPGVADNSTAINTAAAAAYAAKGKLFMLPGANYPIEAQVQLSCECECSGATLTTAGALNSGACVALLVGSRTGSLESLRFRLPNVVDGSRSSGATWTSGRVGIELANLTACEVHIGLIEQFAIGLHVTSGAGIGSQDNTFFVRGLVDNKVQVQYEPLTTADYVNENTLIGGTFDFDTSVGGPAVSGTRQILLINLGLGTMNGNTFIKCDLEGDAPEYHVECQGSENQWIGCRWETTVATSPKVYFNSTTSDSAQRNTIIGGFASDQIVFSGDGTDNVVHALEQICLPHSNANGALVASNENSNADPAYVVMPAGFLTSGASQSSAYAVQIGANSSNWKATGDAYPRMSWVNGNYQLRFGVGAAAPSVSVGIDPNTGWGKFDGGSLHTMIASSGGTVGFYDKSPVAQATRAGQLTDSTGGTPASTLVDVTTTGIADPAKCDNNFASVAARLNALELIIHNLGLSA